LKPCLFDPPQKYFVPANNPSSYRRSGTGKIVKSLKEKIGIENVILNAEIIQIGGQRLHKITLLSKLFLLP
jgi:hypothetical protein